MKVNTLMKKIRFTLLANIVGIFGKFLLTPA